jgi:PIN domain nuclease of toxin-antitoxin system
LRLLLDTHVWLWGVGERSRLSSRVVRALGQRRNEVWLSPLSIWETVLLAEKGRLTLDRRLDEWIGDALGRYLVHEATLNHQVARSASEVTLPHRDPVDRLLVATARVYELTLVTADERLIRARPCPILSAR